MSNPEYVYNPDHISDINPLQAPRLAWEYIEPYLSKYNVEFKQAYPDVPIEGPTITWKIFQRKPGQGPNASRNKKRYLDHRSEGDNTVQVRDLGYYTLLVDYVIYDDSSSVLDNLTWDFENALLEAESPLQTRYAGFHIRFISQEPDGNDTVRKPEFKNRTLRFEFIVPVHYKRVFREIRNIDIQLWGNELAYIDVEFTYDGSLVTEFDLPTYKNIAVVHSIKRKFDSLGYKTLDPGTDYSVKRAAKDRVYIEWNEFGSVPDNGETFWITYTVSTVIATVDKI